MNFIKRLENLCSFVVVLGIGTPLKQSRRVERCICKSKCVGESRARARACALMEIIWRSVRELFHDYIKLVEFHSHCPASYDMLISKFVLSLKCKVRKVFIIDGSKLKFLSNICKKTRRQERVTTQETFTPCLHNNSNLKCDLNNLFYHLNLFYLNRCGLWNRFSFMTGSLVCDLSCLSRTRLA